MRALSVGVQSLGRKVQGTKCGTQNLGAKSMGAKSMRAQSMGCKAWDAYYEGAKCLTVYTDKRNEPLTNIKSNTRKKTHQKHSV